VHEAILGDSPALRINASLALKNGEEYYEYLVRRLLRSPLGEVAQLPEVKEKFERAQSMKVAGLHELADRYTLEKGEIVVFDVEEKDGILISRYAPYHFFPNARYSAGILKTASDAKITAMRNPWREFPSIFLGKIFKEFGGGGHRRVGSVLLSGESAPEAESVLDQILQEIRKEDSTLRESPPYDKEFQLL
jgi:hypothetical protein